MIRHSLHRQGPGVQQYLKKLIKEESAHDLAHLDAKDLMLYKVSLSAAEVDSRWKAANIDFKANSAVTRILLQPLEELRDVFRALDRFKKVMFIFSLNMLRLVRVVIGRFPLLMWVILEESTPTNLRNPCVLQPKQVALAPQQFCESCSTAPPSGGAKPMEFRKGQEEAPITATDLSMMRKLFRFISPIPFSATLWTASH
jgi:hypothetical protein